MPNICLAHVQCILAIYFCYVATIVVRFMRTSIVLSVLIVIPLEDKYIAQVWYGNSLWTRDITSHDLLVLIASAPTGTRHSCAVICDEMQEVPRLHSSEDFFEIIDDDFIMVSERSSISLLFIKPGLIICQPCVCFHSF